MMSLKFAPFSSDIELPFYTSLASHKINHDKLDDSARRLLGLYELNSSEDPNVSCRMQIRGNALTSDELVFFFLFFFCGSCLLADFILQGSLKTSIELRVLLKM